MKNNTDIPCPTNNLDDMGQKIPIKNTPKDDEVWNGIGGHFDHLSQIIYEFIDNSLSNFLRHKSLLKDIVITFKDAPNKKVEVTIEDNGTGINNLDTAFSLGGKSDNPDSPLNEHGFGMKHALASANADNDNWAIYTRTQEDFEKKQFKKICSPYKLFDYSAEIIEDHEEKWPGRIFGSGTYVKFQCSWEMFKTIRKKALGQPPTAIDAYMPMFKEDLGFVYSNIINAGLASISINSPKANYPVASIDPKWIKTIKSGKEDFDLGNGKVLLEYQFGSIEESPYTKYYKRNQASQGLEIRINGRLLMYNIFDEIWDREKHNVYNHLLVKVNLVSDDSKKLPKTRTSKNGLREGDIKLVNLYKWVLGHYPTPAKGTDPNDEDEQSLFERLRDIKDKQLQKDCASTQQYIFKEIGEKARIDLYVFYNGKTIIYEGKKEKTTIKDVYQLMMYWDGCVIDNLTPNIGYIISKHHPKSVNLLIDVINKMSDPAGNPYNFEMRYWSDEGIYDI